MCTSLSVEAAEQPLYTLYMTDLNLIQYKFPMVHNIVNIASSII
jgi:hypothetical protein